MSWVSEHPWTIGVGLLLAVGAGGCLRGPDPHLPPLRVGTSADYPPFSSIGRKEIEGLDVEIARRFARDTGRRLELVTFRWPDLTRDLAAGRFDVAMSGVTIRPERTLVGTFTRPMVESGAVVLVRPEVARTAAQVDTPGLRLGVNAGGYLERVARRLFPHTTLVTSAGNQALPGLMETGTVEALLADDVEADVFVPRLPPVGRVGPLTRDRKAYLVRDPGLAVELDGWLRAREADGILADLRGRWLGTARRHLRSGFESDLDALVALVDLRLAFMPFVAAAKERAGLPVTDREQEERVLDGVRATAGAHHLAPEPVVEFFRAQMAAARMIERSFLATSQERRSLVEPLDLTRDIRPALAAVSEAIVTRAAAVAGDREAFAKVDATALSERFDPFLTPLADRRAIARGILALRPTAR
ncbi:MAG: transporter substrate-binding domain-containing protein [Candidatus Binatia bacterium]